MQVTPVNEIGQASLDPGTPLDQLARNLAENHSIAHEKNPKQRILLFRHIPVWKKILTDAYQYFRATSANEITFSRAGEWMLDNFYIVEQTFHLIEEDLPKGYLDQLPKLDNTDLKDYPRVFSLAWELIGYNQGQLDFQQLTSFVQEYQRAAPLNIGELWALPTMFRIGILEKLATAVTSVIGQDSPDLLQKQSILPIPANITNETIVANCFISLRLLAVSEWKSFFEQTSLVEQILATDPARIYARMDFDTRNQYRSIIEEMARHSDLSEEAVAQKTVECARQAETEPNIFPGETDRKGHVGFYLIDSGRPYLEAQIGYRSVPGTRLIRWILAHSKAAYLGSIAAFSFLVVSVLLAYTYLSGGSLAHLVAVGVLGSGLALEAATNLTNWAVTHIIPPRVLARMDFSRGIPPGYRTMVVVPMMLSNPAEIDSALKDLEQHFLGNPDPQLTFALLSDYLDSTQPELSADAPLLEQAQQGVVKLNHKYKQRAPFYLFHRERVWNASEEAWIGWERKRGKLAEFNRLILGQGETSYKTQLGNLEILPEIKYVITLDADTSLPRGSASRLVATLAHPLNKAVFSEDGRSSVAGYTILQPRVAIKPTSANRSLFSRINSGNTGFDLYTLAVSDVYQDLFGEGSYVGKGIYDVASFERSFAGQVPENALLSHDLFEGMYGRAGLVTDIVLYEDYPSRYLVHTRRLQRWIRGDWQLLPWLFRQVPTENGTDRNRFSLLDRWKIFDNLRRSLLAPMTFAYFWLAWLVLPGSPWLWTAFLLLGPALTTAVQTIHDVRKNLHNFTLKDIIAGLRVPFARWLMAILFLPYEAYLSLSAVGTTIIRLLIAKRHFLQWITAAHFSRTFKNTQPQTWLEMASSLVFNVLLGLVIIFFRPANLIIAAPFLILWTISPQIAYSISRPIVHKPAPLQESQVRYIQRLARRTWAFFERFTGPNDHWLPPDHFQENPRSSVAHYTTPTNIGLYLLSSLSAYDLGYIGLFELAVRLRNTFENMDKLERYRGHWLNWYDTKTMMPMPPRYVSTVDSGNLAACLITFKEGCLAMEKAPLISRQQWRGLLVILDILTDILGKLEKDNQNPAFQTFESEIKSISKQITSIMNKPWAWTGTIQWLSGDGWYRISGHLMGLLESAEANLDQEVLTDLQLYLDTLHQQLVSMQRNIKLLAPWFSRVDHPPRLFAQVNSALVKPWQTFLEKLPSDLPALAGAAAEYDRILAALKELEKHLQDRPGPAKPILEARDWCRRLDNDLTSAKFRVETLLIGFNDLARQAKTAADEMDFKFLYNNQRQIFHIGYNAITERTR